MRTSIFISAVAVATGLTLTACGNGGSVASRQASVAATAAPASTTAKANPAVTCGDLEPVMAPVIKDQQSQDKSLEQNWVLLVPDASNNSLTSQGQDLQNAIDATDNVTAAGKLGNDVQSFNSDAQTFLTDESGGLMPGWTPEYKSLKSDIYAIKSDCGYSSLQVPHH